MVEMTILGGGLLGQAVGVMARGRGDDVRILGRPATGRHRLDDFAARGVVVEASRADAVVANLATGLDAGCRRFVIATTGWMAPRTDVEALLREHDAAAVAASNFSIGVVLFGRLVEAAVGLFGPVEAFDPSLLEWHRRSKRDRPSGTAVDLARRIVSAHPRLAGSNDPGVVPIRAGASPGMHLVVFDAVGESVELRLTARDRSAYAAGILAASDWLWRGAPPGQPPFFPPLRGATT